MRALSGSKSPKKPLNRPNVACPARFFVPSFSIKYMFANTFSSKRSTARAVTLYTHHFGCALIQLHSVEDELEKHLEHPGFVDSVPGRPELAQLPARCRDSAACGRRLTVLRVPSVCARTEGKQPALSLAFSHSSFLHGIQMAQLVGPARRGRCGPAAARITHRRGKTMLWKSPPARAYGAHRRRTSASLPCGLSRRSPARVFTAGRLVGSARPSPRHAGGQQHPHGHLAGSKRKKGYW